MKKILSTILLLWLSMAMWATKTLYLVPNSNWTQANAKLAVYYYNNTTNGWSEFMTAVSGETNVFTTTIPDGYTSIIFCRMNSAATTRNWENKWNQSADLTLTDGKDMFVMADGWDAVSGTWQTYSAGTPIVVPTKSVPSEAPDVMLQAFYWDSYTDKGYGDNRWSTMLSQAEEIGTYFDLVWFPPCSQSSGGTGYIPKQYSNLNSDWGSETDLRSLISALHNKGTRAVADIVINHVTGDYGWCSFATMNFGDYGTFSPDASWICQTDEMNSDAGAGDCRGKATGANDDGYGGEANYTAARDWDHTNSQVQAMCRAYLQWMKNDVGFDGWRYDYGKGFHHSHINDYNTAAGAYMSVVEYWDGDPNVIRQRLEDASWNNMAFDFGTKYDALNNGICSYNYSKCAGAGMLGAGLRKHAVTFVDNHDTFTRNDSEFGGQNNSMSSGLKDRLLQANAYILSMPGIPCVFYPHWVTYKSEIKAMIDARHLTGVHSESEVKDEYATGSGYQATIVGKKGYIVLQLGDKAGNNIEGFTKKASGNGYAIWISVTSDPEPENPEETATVYYVNTSGWTKVNAYTWKGETNRYKEWPGEAMTKTNKKANEKDVYSYTFPAEYTKIIFNDGGSNQTADLTWSEDKPYYYDGKWYASLEDIPAVQDPEEPEDPEQPVDSATVYFVNTLDWTKVNTFVWPAEGDAYKAWPGETATKEADQLQGYDVYSYTFPAKYENIIFNDGRVQTADLKWSAVKPYFVATEVDAEGKIKGTWYAKEDVPAAPEPVVPAKFYVTGDSALVVDAGLDKSKQWNPAAIKSTADTLELNLKADVYYVLKLTTDGTWNTAKGYNELTEKADGLVDDGNDHNIGFKLKEAGKVQVIYFVKDEKVTFKLAGTFVTTETPEEPEDPEQPVDSVTVYYVNASDWAKVNAYVWKGETGYKEWPGETATKEADQLQGYDVYSYTFPAKYENIIFNDGSVQTINLTWSVDKPYFYPTEAETEGKIKGTWYAKEDVPAAPEPVVPAKFYVTGNSALVVDAGLDESQQWDPAAIKSTADTLELNLKADVYYVLKLTVNGTWQGENNIFGYNELTEKADGLVDDGNDHNIGFKLKEAGKVQVIYFVKDEKVTFKLAGAFVTTETPEEPEDPEQPVDSVTVYYVNASDWAKVNAYVWKGETGYKEWPGEAMTKTDKKANDKDVYSYTFPAEYTNVIFSEGGNKQSADLTWDTNKPYFYVDEWYASIEEIPSGQPVAAKFYVTGNSALVVDAGLDESQQWDPAAIKSTADTLELNLKADVYYVLKLTTDGTWNTAKGYNELTEKADGLVDDGNDHNIGFKLKEAGKVQVIYFVKDEKVTFKLAGTFVVAEPLPVVADGFYLMGTMNEWQPTEDYQFTANEGQSGEYYLGVTLTEGAELKVAKVQNGKAVTWYPAEGDNFVVTAAYAGAKVIYFREEYNADWANFGGYIYIAADVPDGISNITAEGKAVKVLIGNRLLIVRDGKTYDACGALVR